ncbi:OLC1v1036525C1 [Oldenlandia corymbosa var. corymbosa]|uniref:OLC1v1036525C1 n=1 Tax=Oldenlandia corymbosa var. corymbosa TaxID=529605 RepID=A0AAV1CY79_OLDCO|nr:OLC1v1036525C1 [Oldenlandia corymbosa var. corymbosa]
MANCNTFTAIILFLTLATVGKTQPVPPQRQPILLQRIPTPTGTVGPETIKFDRSGAGPYTGVSDGRIVRWNSTQNRWINFAVTTPNRTGCEGPFDHTLTESRCGRPLGLSFNQKTRELYMADAYFGLLKVGPNGGVARQLASAAQGKRFGFTNAVVVDQNTGIVYFTDSSARFPRPLFPLIIATRDDTGRLLKFDPKTNAVTVLANKLMFPNGVALTRNGEFLLVAETTNNRILKYRLKSSGPGNPVGRIGVFAKLPGQPDNINRNKDGGFWVALISSVVPNYTGLGLAARLDRNGKVVEILRDQFGTRFKAASDVLENRGSLWVGSSTEPAVVRLAA